MMRADLSDDYENELSEDYEGRCGNCHSLMKSDDKYCKYCGTQRGKGKFLPYENITYCVYGPPVKEVFTCKTCGYRWAVLCLGRDHSKYCPQCRSEQIDEKWTERDRREFVGLDLSEKLPSGTQFLSEKEVKQLLELRTKIDKANNTAFREIIEYGFTDWDKAENHEPEELTEREAGRANLEKRILADTEGDNPFAMRKQCPVCRGKMIAGIRYLEFNITGKREYTAVPYTDIDGDGVYINSARTLASWDYRWPVYHCLQCGSKFS